MEIEWTIKNIIILLIICFVIVNVVFIFVIILEKIKNSDIGNETLNKRKIIEHMKAKINFNDTYEISENDLIFYYSNYNLNNPAN